MLKQTKTRMINLYTKLCQDNTAMSNQKALDMVHAALACIQSQEKQIIRLQTYKYSFILLALFSYIFLGILFTYLIPFYGATLNKKHETKVVYNNRRIIVNVARRTREVRETHYSSRSKFIANKIKELNPAADAVKLANLILVKSSTAGVDPLLVAAIIRAESNFSNTARSNAGARGLMQVLPTTASYMLSSKYFDLHNANHSLSIGISYIKYVSRLFNQDIEKALMAYNWGPDNLIKAIKHKRTIPHRVKQYAQNIITTANKWNTEFSIEAS